MLFIFIFCFCLEAWVVKSNIVRIEALWLQRQDQIQLNFFLTNGYGVQKGSLHKIELYALDKGHQGIHKIREKIRQYGHLVRVKKTLSGITAVKNKKYFSSLAPLVFKKIKNLNKDYAVQGKLFYCSFKGAFCSIQVFEVLIPKEFQKSVIQ